MRLPEFAYETPKSLSEACRLAARGGKNANIIAGGTDILQAMKYGLKKPETLIDISLISDLNKISYNSRKGLTAGPLVTLRRLAAHEIVKEKYPLLTQAALSVGNAQLQTMGTVGGNLCQDSRCIYYNLPPVSRQGFALCFKLGGKVCHAVRGSKFCWAAYAGDMAPALLALRATVTITGGRGEKTIPLEDLYSGRGESPNILKPGQILSGIHIPSPIDEAGIYLKMRMRRSIDYPLLGVAVNLSLNSKKKNTGGIAVALTAIERAPLVMGLPLDGVADGWGQQMETLAQTAYTKAHPIANTSGYSPRYRREMVRVYVSDGIGRAMKVVSGRRKNQ